MEHLINLRWTGEMVSIALKRNFKQSIYDEMHSQIESQLRGKMKKYIDTEELFSILNRANVFAPNVFPDLLVLVKELCDIRIRMGSAEYFRLENGVLDLLRDPVGLVHSEPNVRYFSIHEKLIFFANLGFSTFITREDYEDVDELAKISLYYEMDKLAQQCTEFEVVDIDISQLGVCEVDLATREYFQFLKKFIIDLMNMDCKKMKNYFVEQVFGRIGDKRHYLVDYFEELYDTTIMPYEAEMKMRNKFSVDPERFVRGLYLGRQFVERFKNLFFNGTSYSSDISYMKDNGKKPILRSIRHGPSADNKYFFTAEVVRAINFVHKIKGTMKVFSYQGALVKLDANDDVYHMMTLEDLDKVLEKEKLSRADLKIVDTFSNISLSFQLIQSPKSTLSVFAGTAIIELFKIISRETDQFLNLDVQHFDKFKTFFNSLGNVFDATRDDLYTMKYDSFLEMVKSGTDMLRPLLSRKKPFQPVEREKAMRKKDIWSRIDKTYQLSKKFTFFENLFNKLYEGVKMIKLGEVMDRLPVLLLCAFYGTFPQFAAFVHRQKACFTLSKCALKYVPLTMNVAMMPEYQEFAVCQFHPSANAPKFLEPVVASKEEKVEKEKKEKEDSVQQPLTGFKRGFLNSPSKKTVKQSLPVANGKLVEAEEKLVEAVEKLAVADEKSLTYDELAKILEETKKKLEYEKSQRIENMNKFRQDSDAHMEEIRELALKNVKLEQEKMNAVEMMKNYVSVIEKKKNNDDLMEQKMAQVMQKSENLEKSHSEFQKYYETCSKKLEKAEKEQKLVKAEFKKKLEQEKEKRNVDLKKAENEADSLRETIKKLELEQKRMLNVKKTNFQRAEELKGELASAQKENGRLQANIERSTNKSTELEAEVVKLRKENSRLRGNMERTENICERLRQEFNDGLDTIADLEANLRTAESALELAKNNENSLLEEMGEYLKLLDENDFIEAAKLQLEVFAENSGEDLNREEYELALRKFDKFSDSVKLFHEKVLDNIIILAKYPTLERSQLKQLPQFPEPFTLKIMAKMEENMRGEPPVLENQKADEKEEEAPVCAICIEIMENQQSLIACRVCRNNVHRACFSDWESRNAICVYCTSAMRDDVTFPALS